MLPRLFRNSHPHPVHLTHTTLLLLITVQLHLAPASHHLHHVDSSRTLRRIAAEHGRHQLVELWAVAVTTWLGAVHLALVRIEHETAHAGHEGADLPDVGRSAVASGVVTVLREVLRWEPSVRAEGLAARRVRLLIEFGGGDGAAEVAEDDGRVLVVFETLAALYAEEDVRRLDVEVHDRVPFLELQLLLEWILDAVVGCGQGGAEMAKNMPHEVFGEG